MSNYTVLNEVEYITKKNFIFNKYLEFGNDSPYIFVNHFSNLNYSDYAIKVTDLLKYNILEEEISFLKKYYGKKKIQNKYRLSKIIKKNLFPELIESLVINKRLEFLLEYIKNNNFNINYINYTIKLLDNLYKNTRFLINKLFIDS
tara:strand:- start:1465 stop:1902 length:438 start_codon:yes stop_codon:yes gene_type:complete